MFYGRNIASLMLISIMISTIIIAATDTVQPGLAAVEPSSAPPIAADTAPDQGHHANWIDQPQWAHYFSEHQVTGTALVYDLGRDTHYVYDAKRANTRYLPASTFKILNSLIALELGTVSDEEEIIPWDGVDRGIPAWNQDQSMRQAIANSTVWFYQELARRAGEKNMQHYVNLASYGNQNIGGGIDHFWLDGKLRISAREQIDFLVDLHNNQVPFSQRNINIVKDILIMRQTDTYTMRWKSGWAQCMLDIPDCQEDEFNPQLGWMVGYVERDDNAYFFAINIDITRSEDAAARLKITDSILRDLQIIE